MAWRRPGDKPLSKQVCLVYRRIYVSRGLNELRKPSPGLRFKQWDVIIHPLLNFIGGLVKQPLRLDMDE